ncbi:MAG: TIGR02453 family protein [Cycloclasticus sp. symbiont of Poecilosclerida sp. M]|nr:MAG: TIGR02453 family protein [Cycloclasticus sp. symbiont of Poecilosclerida sp. M]
MFTHKTFQFLEQLSQNNNRPWFNENKAAYEVHARTPALEFIEEIAPQIKQLSPHFKAIAKNTGGSLMRIYRDTRFAKDKTPYKTNISLHFRHEASKDAHAPCFYLNISPTSCYVAAGIWRPSGQSLSKIREMISDNPVSWQNTLSAPAFKRALTLSTSALKTYPRGYAKDHPLIHDLKRTEFIASHSITKEQAISPELGKLAIKQFKTARSFVDYLCIALDLPF